jgi:hypothetical protein
MTFSIFEELVVPSTTIGWIMNYAVDDIVSTLGRVVDISFHVNASNVGKLG